jgi:dienelactone hydrolase
MLTETISYLCDGVTLKGYLAYTGDAHAKRPAVIIAPTWKGLDEFCRQKAQDLAAMGYIAFAADLFGDGVNASNDDEAFKLITPLFTDRSKVRERIVAAYEVISQHPMVDQAAIGAIGFCFGGMTVIELLRSGVDLAGVVSFHGVLGDTLGPLKAKLAPNAEDIQGSLLILHGYKDPLVKPEDVANIQQEFSRAGVDWQMNIYGDAVHAFTNPLAKNEDGGMLYDPKAAMRSWQAMSNFFEEIFP